MIYPRTFLLALLLSAFALPAYAIDLLLAKSWNDRLDPAEYWVSEKLDGVRAYWDGEQLWTRGGYKIVAPAWFIRDFPKRALDGELWAGRGQFEVASTAARQQKPDERIWRQLEYWVFELPQAGGDFSARSTEIQRLTTEAQVPWLQAVPQFRVPTRAELWVKLLEVTQAGGEGLMLHRADAIYVTGRSDDLLKLKRHDDAEAQVVGHTPGRGRLAGKLGSLEVVTADGKRFRIGSGLTDAQRKSPPPIGSWITYRYNGLTAYGVPRFPRFLRLRPADGPYHPQ
jgi:DNA ligase-1